MNHSAYKNQTGRFLTTILIFSALNIMVSGANAANPWQEKQLLNPSEQQLDREQRGAVTIYSGFTDRQVMAALDDQFSRVESMMFIKTKVTDSKGKVKINEKTGEPVTEDDDC